MNTEIDKVKFAKKLIALLSEYDEDLQAPGSIEAIDAKFLALIRHLAEKLRLARDRGHDSRPEHRVGRISNN